MSALQNPSPLRARKLMRPYALLYAYRNRLRAHTAQEALAGLGVATAVALVFATLTASDSVTGSAEQVVHAVVGPASLQLRAYGEEGLDERLLTRVEHLPGVQQAAPLLEQTGTLLARNGRQTTVEVAGADVSLTVLDGLAHTVPVAALSGGIGLSQLSAHALGDIRQGQQALLDLRGRPYALKVSAVLGAATFGALSHATVAVIPLSLLQRLSGLPGRISRVLIQTQPGRESAVRNELLRLAGGRVAVAPADQDIGLLRQALRPGDLASALFAAISALLGFLIAFNAFLLTIPERRQEIADLRVDGTRRSAIVQMVLFQSLCLGVVASIVGLIAGYLLTVNVFHQSPGYLAQAFTLGANTVIATRPLLLAIAGGVLAPCLAAIVPLLDLRRGRPLDAAYREDGARGHGLDRTVQKRLFAMALGLVLLASGLFVVLPSAAIVTCVILALATALAVPLVLTGILHAAEAFAHRRRSATLLPLALTSLRSTTSRSLALAATGAVALFGSIALNGARGDLLRGIDNYTAHYVEGANIWIVNPHDNQAINQLSQSRRLAEVAHLPGVSGVRVFKGGFLDVGARRVWVIAWPPNTPATLLDGQVVAGSASVAAERIQAGGGWITVSDQLAAERHTRVGGTLTLPTPAGEERFRIAATTTNLGWSPGAILMPIAAYSRAWNGSSPTAIGVDLGPKADLGTVRGSIRRALGAGSGLEVLTADERASRIGSSANEGLEQLAAISTLLVLAAILALIAALASSIWQRRSSLAGLRIEGAKPARLRRVLLIEVAIVLFAGCLTGVIAGIYGQAALDSYLRHVTGFPVAGFATSMRPIEVFLIVISSVVLATVIPGWLASRVPATLAFNE